VSAVRPPPPTAPQPPKPTLSPPPPPTGGAAGRHKPQEERTFSFFLNRRSALVLPFSIRIKKIFFLVFVKIRRFYDLPPPPPPRSRGWTRGRWNKFLVPSFGPDTPFNLFLGKKFSFKSSAWDIGDFQSHRSERIQFYVSKEEIIV
jgi:hypothetical protein